MSLLRFLCLSGINETEKRGISVCDGVWQSIDRVTDREGEGEGEGGKTGRWVSVWPIWMLATELTSRSHIGDTLTPSAFSLSPTHADTYTVGLLKWGQLTFLMVTFERVGKIQ